MIGHRGYKFEPIRRNYLSAIQPVRRRTVLWSETSDDVCVMSNTFTKFEFLTGHSNGEIHLWMDSFIIGEKIRTFVKDSAPIVYISCLSQNDFLSVSENGNVRIWNKHNASVKRTIVVPWQTPDYFAVLPDGLLAISKYVYERIQTVEVWDFETGVVMRGIQNCFKGRGMPLAVTTSGFLVSAPCIGGEMCVWKINKSECDLICKTEISRINSLVALPTDEIVTAAKNITIYKLKQCGEIYKRKVIEHKNIIDLIIPIGGYKFLTVDRSRNHSGILKMWYCKSDKCDYLDNSKHSGYPKLVLHYNNTIFASKGNKIFCKQFFFEQFKFSKNLAEIRKNVRILAQAVRTESSFFLKIPIEITIKIVLMTTSKMNEYEKNVSEEFAWSHFCKPLYYESSFIVKEKDNLMTDENIKLLSVSNLFSQLWAG